MTTASSKFVRALLLDAAGCIRMARSLTFFRQEPVASSPHSATWTMNSSSWSAAVQQSDTTSRGRTGNLCPIWWDTGKERQAVPWKDKSSYSLARMRIRSHLAHSKSSSTRTKISGRWNSRSLRPIWTDSVDGCQLWHLSTPMKLQSWVALDPSMTWSLALEMYTFSTL